MEVGRRGSGSRSTLSQINVTPLVDVMLVLLIIFMVTAPMMDQGIKVNLPEVHNAPDPGRRTRSRWSCRWPGTGRISIGHSRVDAPDKLVPVLKQILRERNGPRGLPRSRPRRSLRPGGSGHGRHPGGGGAEAGDGGPPAQVLSLRAPP